MDSKCKLPPEVMGLIGNSDISVIIRDNELLCGILDKN